MAREDKSEININTNTFSICFLWYLILWRWWNHQSSLAFLMDAGGLSLSGLPFRKLSWLEELREKDSSVTRFIMIIQLSFIILRAAWSLVQSPWNLFKQYGWSWLFQPQFTFPPNQVAYNLHPSSKGHGLGYWASRLLPYWRHFVTLIISFKFLLGLKTHSWRTHWSMASGHSR